MSVHTGHRQRLKERFLKEGLDHFEEHQVLELLLFYAIPQRDTNEIAHELIRKFGSLTKVLDAKPEELAQVKYVGDNAATLFQLITAVARYYQVNSAKIAVNPSVRPEFVRKMMLDVLQRGVYFWYVNNGDISPFIGSPFGLTNPDAT